MQPFNCTQMKRRTREQKCINTRRQIHFWYMDLFIFSIFSHTLEVRAMYARWRAEPRIIYEAIMEFRGFCFPRWMEGKFIGINNP